MQISLLTEHELTKLIRLSATIATHLGLKVDDDAELAETQEDIAPEAVLDQIETQNKQSA